MLVLADKTIERTRGKSGGYAARGWLLTALKQYDKAEADISAAIAAFRNEDRPKSAATAGGLAVLGMCRLKQQKYAEAEPVLRECLEIREQKEPGSWLRFNALSMLGGALLGQQKYAEAEPLLLQGYEGMKQREAQIPPGGKIRLPEAVERLVRLYEATNQPEKARVWREKAKPKPLDAAAAGVK
jgi:tetratricopeptide (TPR) repeat protein